METMRPCAAGSSREGEETSNTDAENSSFQCAICLERAKDLVLTRCGLFCWPCLNRWLTRRQLQLSVRKCPVCKGDVTRNDVFPVHRRGEGIPHPQTDNIPLRPPSHRVDNWRQVFRRARFPGPTEETIRHLEQQLDPLPAATNVVHPQNIITTGDSQDSSTRTNLMLSKILTSRGMHNEQEYIISPDYFSQISATDAPQEGENSVNSTTVLPGTSNSSESYDRTIFASTFSSVEQLVDESINQEMGFQVDDFWSLAAEVDLDSPTHESVSQVLDPAAGSSLSQLHPPEQDFRTQLF